MDHTIGKYIYTLGPTSIPSYESRFRAAHASLDCILHVQLARYGFSSPQVVQSRPDDYAV